MAVAQPKSMGKRHRVCCSAEEAALRSRTLELLCQEIDFIPNSEFRAAGHDPAGVVEDLLNSEDKSAAKKVPAELPVHLRRICEAELLTHQQETALFREMNFLKFRANALRSRLNPEQLDLQAVANIESLLARAQQIRDHIIKANMRLVVSIVKKFVMPQQSFDDMLSDGIFTLMHAVEKFDYDRGFRFSTYAYRAIARNAYRSVITAAKQQARFTRDAEEWAFEQDNSSSVALATEQALSNLHSVTSSLVDRLDRRERFIIRSRFALGAHRRPRTFQYLADKLGVSKERARQLEQRAVNKLRRMAREFDLDELIGVAIV